MRYRCIPIFYLLTPFTNQIQFHVWKLPVAPDLVPARRLVSFFQRLAAICPNSPIAREKQTGSDSDSTHPSPTPPASLLPHLPRLRL